MFSYLAITSRTLREALERVCRYFRLLTDVLRYELIVREDVVTLACLPTTNVIPPSRQVSDFSVAVVHAYVRRAIPDWHLSETLLPYPTPSDTRAHLSFFGIEPRFGSSALALCFPRSFLERPLVRGDAKLAGLLEDVVSGSLAKLPSQPGFTARTHHALLLALKDGQASLGEVAKRLGTTPRTLQRRLADEGASFHGVLDECRRDLALPLLSGARLTVHEIAFAVGFSEPSAFQRAFRRWTGETPAHFRARQRTSPPD
jgi:AraC-like DNA-binding protein